MSSSVYFINDDDPCNTVRDYITYRRQYVNQSIILVPLEVGHEIDSLSKYSIWFVPACLQMYVYGSVAKFLSNLSGHSLARKFGRYVKKYGPFERELFEDKCS
jgi:hypothetical protein